MRSSVRAIIRRAVYAASGGPRFITTEIIKSKRAIMPPMSSVVILITSIVALPSIDPVTSSFPTCTTNTECEPDSCCLIKPFRYAIPTCMLFQQEGEQCRIKAETITTNLSYPDQSQIEVIDIHYILCPCADKLSCNHGICEPEDSGQIN